MYNNKKIPLYSIKLMPQLSFKNITLKTHDDMFTDHVVNKPRKTWVIDVQYPPPQQNDGTKPLSQHLLTYHRVHSQLTETHLNDILIMMQKFSSKYTHLKMSSAKYCP